MVFIGGESRDELRKSSARAPTLLYRQHYNKWEPPHTFIEINGDTVIVNTSGGRKIFRSSVVKSMNGPFIDHKFNYKSQLQEE